MTPIEEYRESTAGYDPLEPQAGPDYDFYDDDCPCCRDDDAETYPD